MILKEYMLNVDTYIFEPQLNFQFEFQRDFYEHFQFSCSRHQKQFFEKNKLITNLITLKYSHFPPLPGRSEHLRQGTSPKSLLFLI